MGELARLLHDPRRERDALWHRARRGLRGRASRELLDRALAGLAAVGHRGAWAADGVTGDGAGVLVPLSPVLTGTPGAGLAMCFLREGWLRSAVEDACRAEGLEPAGWREVPTRTSALGVTALASLPRIEQLVLAPSEHPTPSGVRTERGGGPSAFPASTSLRCRSARSRTRRCARRRSSRASTPTSRIRTSPSRSRSSTSASRRTPSRAGSAPSRSGSSATTARSTRSTATSPGPRRASGPSATSRRSPRRSIATGSDSALLDNALELLVRGEGADLAEAVSLLVPPAWQNDPRLDDDVRDFHRYGAMLSEPWDGPAALCFTDGRTSVRALDRNGLRPLRVAVAGDELLAVSSEAGAVPLPDGMPVRRARSGAGRDPDARSRPRPACRRRAPT